MAIAAKVTVRADVEPMIGATAASPAGGIGQQPRQRLPPAGGGRRGISNRRVFTRHHVSRRVGRVARRPARPIAAAAAGGITTSGRSPGHRDPPRGAARGHRSKAAVTRSPEPWPLVGPRTTSASTPLAPGYVKTERRRSNSRNPEHRTRTSPCSGTRRSRISRRAPATASDPSASDRPGRARTPRSRRLTIRPRRLPRRGMIIVSARSTPRRIIPNTICTCSATDSFP